MSSIEELDGKLKVIELAPAKKKQGPELPVAISDVKNKDFDERFAELNRIPLFMRELDETDGADGQNESLEALKSLAFDGEPWEVASSLKVNGDDSYRMREYREAVDYYTRALAVRCGRFSIEELCWLNRAACNIELQNYGKVLQDCAKVLAVNPRNMKALYRSAKACIAVDRLNEAQDVLSRGLNYEPDNVALRQQLTILENKLNTILESQRRKDERTSRDHRQANFLKQALAARRILLKTSPRPPDTSDARIQLSDPEDVTSSLLFPTIFLYPLVYQSDFLVAYPEVYTLQSQLDIILEHFPVWDTNKQYSAQSVDCFMATTEGGLIRFGKQAILSTPLSSGKVEVWDSIVQIYVVPKDLAPEWIQSYKAEKAKTRISS